MKSVTIELSNQQFEENNKSISEIMSMAIEQLFSNKGDTNSALAKIQIAKGIWSDRNDIHDTDKYVSEIRKGTSERMKLIIISLLAPNRPF